MTQTPLEMAQAFLKTQSFSVFLGAEITRFDAEGVEIVLDMRDEFKQQNGFAHGGIISYMADNALTFVAGTVLGVSVLTSEFKINYIKPARGGRLVARSTVVGHSKRQAVTRCDIYSVHGDSETLCATALGTIVAV